MDFTQAQESAIQARNPQLLVSAAAGSGKTAVLVERIYSLVKEDGRSIDRMLICTFTHAAAAEMRDRLETRFAEAALKDRNMQRQAELVETAQISTLHSFCQKIVREHFEVVQIDPGALLCDETTKEKLKRAALEECLNEGFEKALDKEEKDLRAVTGKFTQGELLQMMGELHTFLQSLPDPFPWLSACAAHTYSMQDLESGSMAETFLTDSRIVLDGALHLWEEAQGLAQDPNCKEGYGQNLREDGLLLTGLLEASQKSLSALVDEAAKASFSRLCSYKLTDEAEIQVREAFKALRERYKKRVAEMKKLLPQDGKQAIADLNAMQPALRGLLWLTRRMHEIFMEMKSKRGLLDFADLEHMALQILHQPELQKEISSRYDAVFVDEYQDTSGIQEAILNRLQGPDTSFFYVGDVKQSIYRFRQADPTLFMAKMERFEAAPNASCRKITLNQNFRSRDSVLSAVNRVFEHVLQKDVTEIQYDEDASLRSGKASQGDEPVRLHVLDKAALRAAERPAAEAALIAQEIKRVVGTPYVTREGKEEGQWQYKDMVILLPTAKGVAEVVEKTLAAAEIPVYCEDPQSGLESAEIRQALMHLRLLDNARDDLALLAALRGPLYAMNEEELARIRLQKTERSASFRDALLAASQEETDPAFAARCAAIEKDLEHERFLQRSQPLEEYLWGFLSRSGMYGFYGAQPGGRLRQANLRMLCNQAGEYQKARGGDLHEFLASVTAAEGVRDAKSPTVLSPWENVVRIMTIHKSKGLEFPLVFVMGLGGALHRRQEMSALSLHPKLGAALRYVNEKARTKRNTLLMNAMALRKRAEEKAERARVLYVALTRAKDRLMLVGSGDRSFSTAQQRETLHGKTYEVWEAKSMLEWLCQTLRNADDIRVLEGKDFSTIPLWETQDETQLSTEPTFFPHKTGGWRVVFHIDTAESMGSEREAEPTLTNALQGKEKPANRLQALLAEIAAPQAQGSTFPQAGISYLKEERPLGFWGKGEEDPIAPRLSLSHAPLKLGVTSLVRSLDKGEEAGAFLRPHLLSEVAALPAYLQDGKEQTALLRGTATHKALALAPFPPLRECLLKGGPMEQAVEKELSLLRMEGRITEEERSLTDPRVLARFFTSGLGRRALGAERVYREWSFNLRAKDLSPSILQGVIDLCFLERGAWVLVDYKTDRVESAADLWPLYGAQVEIYRRALSAATGLPVAEAALFALGLGEADSQIAASAKA